jgi:membrane protease YdiL (CAAX protease family)
LAQRTENKRWEMAESYLRQYVYSARMLVLYFALAFAITWAFLISALTYLPEERQLPFIVLAAFGPFLSAIITIWTHKGSVELRQWLRQIFTFRIPLTLYLVGAFLLPIGVGVLQFGLYRILGGETDFSTAEPWYLYLFYLIPTALLTGGNEEPGWRGFALTALLERVHPVSASIILGVIHSAWHLPLMNHYGTTFGWYLFNLVPLTFIFNWLYLKSRKSIFPVMLFHAGTNVIERFIPTPMVMLGGLGTQMVLRGLVYWGITIVLLIVTKGSLGYTRGQIAQDKLTGTS